MGWKSSVNPSKSMQMMPWMLTSDYNYELSWALVSRAFGQWETPTGYQKKGGGKSLSPLPVGCHGLSVPWMTTASWSGAPSLNSYNSLLLVHYDVFSIAWHVIPKHLQPTLWFYFYMKWKENIESFGYEILGINICFFFAWITIHPALPTMNLSVVIITWSPQR